MSPPFAFAAIDFETTGSVAGYPVEPWQVGVVVITADREPLFWESLLRIGPRPFHPRAPGRHEQIRQELTEAPTLEECLPVLRQYCAQVPLVAHNCATEKKCLRDQLPMEKWGPWLDSLKLSRAAWPDFSSHKLENLLLRLDLMGEMQKSFPDREAHDALFDAYGSALLMMHLLDQPGWADSSLKLLTHPDLSGFYQKRK